MIWSLKDCENDIFLAATLELARKAPSLPTLPFQQKGLGSGRYSPYLSLRRNEKFRSIISYLLIWIIYVFFCFLFLVLFNLFFLRIILFIFYRTELFIWSSSGWR